jgi:hypothetical protein
MNWKTLGAMIDIMLRNNKDCFNGLAPGEKCKYYNSKSNICLWCEDNKYYYDCIYYNTKPNEGEK